MTEKSMVNSLRNMLEEAKSDSHTDLLNKEKAIEVAKDLFGASEAKNTPNEENEAK